MFYKKQEILAEIQKHNENYKMTIDKLKVTPIQTLVIKREKVRRHILEYNASC